MRHAAYGIDAMLAFIFLASFIGKTVPRGAFDRFTTAVAEMRLVPPRLGRGVARLVVAAELLVLALLVTPLRATACLGLAGAAALLGVFSAAIGTALRDGTRRPCHCFGRSTTPMGIHHVVRNITLACLALADLAFHAMNDAYRPADSWAAIAVGLVLGGLLAALDDIYELFKPMSRAA
ncbi:hypothetical protein GCM10010149_45090 [Nonomuraea roseoviolacea subsp. roseoviolacea]|uniref:MauE/DoxX family redox-associated membrane protein n=1 Tax=Nonomuraea roseoviolacea TaxID=103837 RepID=UPI0031DE7FE2